MKKLKDSGMDEDELEKANSKFKASSTILFDEGIQDSSAQWGVGYNMKVLIGVASLTLFLN